MVVSGGHLCLVVVSDVMWWSELVSCVQSVVVSGGQWCAVVVSVVQFRSVVFSGSQYIFSTSGIHTDARLCKISHNLKKILAFEGITEKIISFNLILMILSHFFCVFNFPAHFHGKFFLI